MPAMKPPGVTEATRLMSKSGVVGVDIGVVPSPAVGRGEIHIKQAGFYIEAYVDIAGGTSRSRVRRVGRRDQTQA